MCITWGKFMETIKNNFPFFCIVLKSQCKKMSKKSFFLEISGGQLFICISFWTGQHILSTIQTSTLTCKVMEKFLMQLRKFFWSKFWKISKIDILEMLDFLYNAFPNISENHGKYIMLITKIRTMDKSCFFAISQIIFGHFRSEIS